MPFLNLNEESLGIINVLIQYFVEGNTVKHADFILKKFPNCSIAFANELARLSDIQKKVKQDSAVVVYHFLDTPHRDDYLYRIKHEIRGLDTYWETSHNNIKLLFILMPLISRYGVESYRIRINALLLQEFDITLNQDAIKLRSCQLSTFKQPIDVIDDLLSIA